MTTVHTLTSGTGKRLSHDEQRNLDYLRETVEGIWKVIKGAEEFVHGLFPLLKSDKYPNLPEKLTFLHAEEITRKISGTAAQGP